MLTEAQLRRVLEPAEVTFLIHHARGGVDTVVRELPFTHGQVPAELERLRGKVQRAAQAAHVTPPPAPAPAVELPRAVVRSALAPRPAPAPPAPEPALAQEPGEWPHTGGTVRRQVVPAGEERQAGAVKRRREGPPARGPILAAPSDRTEEPVMQQHSPTSTDDEEAGEVGLLEAPVDVIRHDPRQSPILDWLQEHGPGSASMIARDLPGRTSSNVCTRLNQLERGGFVRRTGRTVPGGRGGPQIEWELATEHKPPTDGSTILSSPLTVLDESADMRRRYFDLLLSMLEPDSPGHLFDRIERLCGIEQPQEPAGAAGVLARLQSVTAGEVA